MCSDEAEHEADLVLLESLFKAAIEKKIASMTIFILELVANLMKKKLSDLVFGTEDKSSEEGKKVIEGAMREVWERSE